MHPLQAAMKWAIKHNKFESEADKQQHYRDLAEAHEEFFNLLEEKLYFYPQQFWTRKLVLHIISIHNRECCASPKDEIHIIDPRDSDVEFVQAVHDFHADLKKLDDVRNALMAADQKYAQGSPKEQKRIHGHVRTCQDLWRISYQSMLAKMNAHYRDIREDENSFPGLMNASLSDPVWDYIAELTEKIEKGLREDVPDFSDPTELDGQEDFGKEDKQSDASRELEFISGRDEEKCSSLRVLCLGRWPTQTFSEVEFTIVDHLEDILNARDVLYPTLREIGERTNVALKQLVSLSKGKQTGAKTIIDDLPFPSAAEREDTYSDVNMAWMVVQYIKQLRDYNLEVEEPLLQLAKRLIDRYELLQETGENQGVFRHISDVRAISSRYACDLHEYKIQEGHQLPVDPEVLRWSRIMIKLGEGDEEMAKQVEEAGYPYKTNIDFGNSINYILEIRHHRFAPQLANAFFEYAKAFIKGTPIDERILYVALWFLEIDRIGPKLDALRISITSRTSDEKRTLKFENNSHCLVFLDLMTSTFSGVKSHVDIKETYFIAAGAFSRLGPGGLASPAIRIVVEYEDPLILESEYYKELDDILIKASTVDGAKEVMLKHLDKYANFVKEIGREWDDRILAELESIVEQAKGKADAEPEIDETLDIENIHNWVYPGYVAVMARIYAHMARKFGKEIDIEVLSEVTALIDQANKKASEDEIECGHVVGLCTCDDCLNEAADFECGLDRCDHPVLLH